LKYSFHWELPVIDMEKLSLSIFYLSQAHLKFLWMWKVCGYFRIGNQGQNKVLINPLHFQTNLHSLRDSSPLTSCKMEISQICKWWVSFYVNAHKSRNFLRDTCLYYQYSIHSSLHYLIQHQAAIMATIWQYHFISLG
jgi:hypothetical protein